MTCTGRMPRTPRNSHQHPGIRCWSPNVTRSVVMVSWFTRNCACAPMLYISELCEDCAVANEIDYEIDYAWTCIHAWQRTRDHGVWRLTSTAYCHVDPVITTREPLQTPKQNKTYRISFVTVCIYTLHCSFQFLSKHDKIIFALHIKYMLNSASRSIN